MTTPEHSTNHPHECVPHCVPHCVPEAARAPRETSASPVPSSSIGDALSEPSPLRPNDRVPPTQVTPQATATESVAEPTIAGTSILLGAVVLVDALGGVA